MWSISQIENTIVWRGHAAKKAILDALHREHHVKTRTFELLGGHAALKIDDHLNQLYLWHGCSPDAARIIETLGFDERLAHARDLYGVHTLQMSGGHRTALLQPHESDWKAGIYVRYLR